jgi:hypothetical protein
VSSVSSIDVSELDPEDDWMDDIEKVVCPECAGLGRDLDFEDLDNVSALESWAPDGDCPLCQGLGRLYETRSRLKTN